MVSYEAITLIVLLVASHLWVISTTSRPNGRARRRV